MAQATNFKSPLLPKKGAGKNIDVMYLLRVSGQYKAGPQGGNPNGIKTYDITVPCSHELIQKHGALSAFKNYLAPEAMPLKYPDYQEKGLVTFKIVKSKCDNPELIKNNIHLLDFSGLVLYIEENEYQITTELYEDAETLRQAIEEYEQDPIGYVKTTEPTRAKRHGGKLRDKKKGAMLIQANFDPNYNLGDDDDEDVEGMEVKKPDAVPEVKKPDAKGKSVTD